MTAIFTCGEGPHDIGQSQWDSESGAHTYLEGWLQPLLRKLIAGDVSFQTRQLKQLVMSPRPKSLKPIPKGHSDKAAMAKLIAGNEGCHVLVFMTDADTPVSKEYHAKVDEIKNGFGLISNDVKAVACVPMAASECWLLSDLSAWQQVSGVSEIKLPLQSLETLWGKRDDPNSNHPKRSFARVAKAVELPDDRDTRNRICEASAINKLREKCPSSFGAFEIEFAESN